MPSQNNLLPLHLREEGMKDQKKTKTKQNMGYADSTPKKEERRGSKIDPQ